MGCERFGIEGDDEDAGVETNPELGGGYFVGKGGVRARFQQSHHYGDDSLSSIVDGKDDAGYELGGGGGQRVCQC